MGSGYERGGDSLIKQYMKVQGCGKKKKNACDKVVEAPRDN